jgi:hypothetical protein
MLIRWAGMRLPRRHICVARTMAMIRRALTYPQTCEYVFCHLLASFAASHLAKVSASQPSKPSVEQTKGVKWRRCSRHGSRYFRFFSFSWVAITFAGSQWQYDLALVSVTQTSTIQSVLRAQKPCRRMSPLSSSLAAFALVLLVGQVLTFPVARHGQIKGLSPMAEGVSAFPVRCTSSSWILLCQKITRPPFL